MSNEVCNRDLLEMKTTLKPKNLTGSQLGKNIYSNFPRLYFLIIHNFPFGWMWPVRR